MKKISKKKNKSLTRYLVGGLLMAAIAITFFFLQEKPKSPQELFASNFVLSKNIIEPINKSEEDLNIKELAFYNYEKGYFQKAIMQMEVMFANSNEGYYLFYKANALLKLQKYEEAIRTLKTHQIYNDEFLEQSKWYMALAYLKTNNISESKKILEDLVIQKGYNYKKAKRILGSL
ncbi:MAG: tetratricopeptide (TPR) repeat protein [Patiriisocius sp.]|jgi:tetratricopeptide (TPR) repeat protein